MGEVLKRWLLVTSDLFHDAQRHAKTIAKLLYLIL